MRLLIALCLVPAIAAGAHAAEVKGASRIDAVTVYPSGAEVTRIGKVKVDAGEHTLLFADLPANAVSSSIRVEGKATGKLEIGSVDTRSVSVPRVDDAVAASERRRPADRGGPAAGPSGWRASRRVRSAPAPAPRTPPIRRAAGDAGTTVRGASRRAATRTGRRHRRGSAARP